RRACSAPTRWAAWAAGPRRRAGTGSRGGGGYGFARRQLVVVGACLTAAGAVFFAAAHWVELDPLVRMGMGAAVLATAMVVGAALGLRTVPRRPLDRDRAVAADRRAGGHGVSFT